MKQYGHVKGLLARVVVDNAQCAVVVANFGAMESDIDFYLPRPRDCPGNGILRDPREVFPGVCPLHDLKLQRFVTIVANGERVGHRLADDSRSRDEVRRRHRDHRAPQVEVLSGSHIGADSHAGGSLGGEARGRSRHVIQPWLQLHRAVVARGRVHWDVQVARLNVHGRASAGGLGVSQLRVHHLAFQPAVSPITGADLRFQHEEVVCGTGVRGVALHLDRVVDRAASVLVHVDLEPEANPGGAGKIPQLAVHDVVRRPAINQGAPAAGIVSHLRWQHVSDHNVRGRVWPVVPDIENVFDLAARRDRLLHRHAHLLADFQIGLGFRLASGGWGCCGGRRGCGD